MKRSDSLKRKKEFRYTYRAGKSAVNRLFVLIYTKVRRPETHIGFSVSKKLGGAVTRNRVKRRMREAVTPLLLELKGGYNIIFVAREPVAEAAFPALREAMEQLFAKAGLHR